MLLLLIQHVLTYTKLTQNLYKKFVIVKFATILDYVLDVTYMQLCCFHRVI